MPDRSLVITPSILYFGTPVALVSTVDAAGRPNISPMSSVWALDDRLVLGLATASQGCANLLATGEGVVNLPSASQAASVERLAPTTGRADVHEYKRRMGYRHEPDKFGLAGLTPVASEIVRAPRIAECPLQIEVRLLAGHAATRVGDDDPAFVLLETRSVRVHAHEGIVRPGTQHVDTGRWQPLLYVFRHYFGTGPRLGRNFRAET